MSTEPSGAARIRPQAVVGSLSSDSGAAAARADLETVLVSGESVVAFALQHRLFALVHRRLLAAATSGRFLLLTRRLLGGYDLTGVRWQDIRDAGLTVGMVSATVRIAFSANLSDTAGGEGDTRVIRVAGLRKEPAQALYRECQAQEQSWREKRRVRSIEEMRARAGGVQIATGIYPQGGPERPLELPSGGPPQPDEPTQRLNRAREMLNLGLITDSEYWAIKAKIVDAL
jgi:hypothetical protein